MYQTTPHTAPPSAQIVKLCDELRARALRISLMSGHAPDDEADVARILRDIERVSSRHRTTLGFAPVVELRAYPVAFSADRLTPAERALATKNARERGQGGTHEHGPVARVSAANIPWHGDDAA